MMRSSPSGLSSGSSRAVVIGGSAGVAIDFAKVGVPWTSENFTARNGRNLRAPRWSQRTARPKKKKKNRAPACPISDHQTHT
eukprot:2054592-Prymnesium_polylepis.1